MYLSPRYAAIAAALVGGSSAAHAVTFTTSYSENFDTLASSGTTGAVLPNGWTFVETGTAADATYGIGTGSGTAGNTYSFGATGSTDRAFGTLLSGSLVSTLFAQLTNGNATTISALTVSYIGEMWRLGALTGRPDRLDFAYSINGGAFTDFDALDLVSPVTTGTVGPLDGNQAANRAAISATLSGINLTAGSTIRFRWSDFDASPGADDGLAIDDFSLTPVFAAAGAVPEPATWAMMIAGFALAAGAMRRRRALPVPA